jgi:hypothetical protein
MPVRDLDGRTPREAKTPGPALLFRIKADKLTLVIYPLNLPGTSQFGMCLSAEPVAGVDG